MSVLQMVGVTAATLVAVAAVMGLGWKLFQACKKFFQSIDYLMEFIKGKPERRENDFLVEARQPGLIEQLRTMQRADVSILQRLEAVEKSVAELHEKVETGV